MSAPEFAKSNCVGSRHCTLPGTTAPIAVPGQLMRPRLHIVWDCNSYVTANRLRLLIVCDCKSFATANRLRQLIVCGCKPYATENRMRIAMASPCPPVAVRPVADAGSGTDTDMSDIFTDTARDGLYQAGHPQPPTTFVSKI